MFRAPRARRPGRHPACSSSCSTSSRAAPSAPRYPAPHRPRPDLRPDRGALRHPRRGGQPHRGPVRRPRRPRPSSPARPRGRGGVHRRAGRDGRRADLRRAAHRLRRLLPRVGRLRGALAGGPRRHRPGRVARRSWPAGPWRDRWASWRARCSTPPSWPSAAGGGWRSRSWPSLFAFGVAAVSGVLDRRRPPHEDEATAPRLARPRRRRQAALGAGGRGAPPARRICSVTCSRRSSPCTSSTRRGWDPAGGRWAWPSGRGRARRRRPGRPGPRPRRRSRGRAGSAPWSPAGLYAALLLVDPLPGQARAPRPARAWRPRGGTRCSRPASTPTLPGRSGVAVSLGSVSGIAASASSPCRSVSWRSGSAWPR